VDGPNVDVVTLEDLLYHLPEAQRPKIRVTRANPVSGVKETVWVPLQPEHVYLVKCDVQGFDGPVAYRFVVCKFDCGALWSGCWLLAAGCWLLAAGCWLLAAGCWLLARAGYCGCCFDTAS
jgi:hypothetical protein